MIKSPFIRYSEFHANVYHNLQPVHNKLTLCVSFFIYLFIYLFAYLFIYLFVYLFIYLFIYDSGMNCSNVYSVCFHV